MRNLDECQAEVFRRSEKRINQRKQRRKHVLITCIPLVLCITALGTFALPNLDFFISPDRVKQEGIYTNYANGTGAEAENITVTITVGFVEVSGNGIFRGHADAEDVQGILHLIDKIVAGTDDVKESDKINDYQVTDSVTSEMTGIYNGTGGYRICVKIADGTTKEYLLKEEVLIDQETKEKFPMSEDTYGELMDALGIAHN